jgi:hypothetical protein
MSSKSKKITTKSSHLVGIQKHHMCEPLKIKSKPPYQILINISMHISNNIVIVTQYIDYRLLACSLSHSHTYIHTRQLT